MLSIFLIVVASIYLAATFRHPLTEPLPRNLGVNAAGVHQGFAAESGGRGWG